ncbi:hypothetical protein, partial [uncultured Faecalibaculum sp.]|uniref:hypothetical protein n=1 Tax=uncultured Faecalibaculum sp. TaxID=1729681 RepID=UPI0025E31F68
DSRLTYNTTATGECNHFLFFFCIFFFCSTGKCKSRRFVQLSRISPEASDHSMQAHAFNTAPTFHLQPVSLSIQPPSPPFPVSALTRDGLAIPIGRTVKKPAADATGFQRLYRPVIHFRPHRPD